MRKSKIDIEIKKCFKDRPSFSREELYDFYLKYEPDLNPRTFGWRVFDLKKKNIIRIIRRGIYKISDKQQYQPSVDKMMKKIVTYLEKAFYGNNPDYRVWTTKWINEFSLHQVFKYFYIVEVPYEQTEVVFQELKGLRGAEVYHEPNEDIMYKYVIEGEEPIVVKQLIQRSPVKRIQKLKAPPLEKILVDLFCDENIFYMYRGRELEEIFRNALLRYELNFTKLFNYAERRGRKNEIQDYMTNKFPELLEEILDD
ncbi:MAG: hypothetical protein H6609_19730 [Ignavibacteriales bacterium]|nr:hypothetical protein [Ignavibacteriales bacterium]